METGPRKVKVFLYKLYKIISEIIFEKLHKQQLVKMHSSIFLLQEKKLKYLACTDYFTDTFVIKKSFGAPRDVCFDSNETTYFQITFADVVVFYTWVCCDTNRNNVEFINALFLIQADNKINEFIPDMKRLKSKTYGQFQASTYVKNGYECVSATSLGWVIIWGISFFDMPYNSSSHNNKKLLIKAIRLQKNSITTIKFSDKYVSKNLEFSLYQDLCPLHEIKVTLDLKYRLISKYCLYESLK